MKKIIAISTLFAAAAGTLFADENPENQPAEIATTIDVPADNSSVPASAAEASAEAEDADERALAIVARESVDDAEADEIEESETAKLIDEALEKSAAETAASGSVPADSASISAGTDFTIFGHTFHVDPTKTHAPLVEPLDLAPAVDKRVRIVLGNSETATTSTKKPATTTTDDDDDSTAGTVAATALNSAGTASTAGTSIASTTLAGTNSGIATRSFFSAASAGTVYYSTGTTLAAATPISDNTTASTSALPNMEEMMLANGKTYGLQDSDWTKGTANVSSLGPQSVYLNGAEAFEPCYKTILSSGGDIAHAIMDGWF